MNQEKVSSIVDKNQYDYVKLILDFKEIIDYLLDQTGLSEPTDEMFIMVDSFIMLRFVPYSKGDESKLSTYVFNIDSCLELLFADESKREDVHQEVNNRIASVVKKQIPNYNANKEFDKAFLSIDHISKSTYSLLIESRII